MIIISDLVYAKTSYGYKINSKFKQEQLARQIEKFLLRKYSIVCNIEVKR